MKEFKLVKSWKHIFVIYANRFLTDENDNWRELLKSFFFSSNTLKKSPKTPQKLTVTG
jgi:hypothetical protein